MHNRFKKNPTLRYGMVGGGATSQIGDSHRVALQRDGYYDLLAGVFDINPQDGRKFGAELGLDPERVYTDYREMAGGICEGGWHSGSRCDDSKQYALRYC